MRRSETVVELESLARSQFDSLWQTYKAEIKNNRLQCDHASTR